MPDGKFLQDGLFGNQKVDFFGFAELLQHFLDGINIFFGCTVNDGPDLSTFFVREDSPHNLHIVGNLVGGFIKTIDNRNKRRAQVVGKLYVKIEFKSGEDTLEIGSFTKDKIAFFFELLVFVDDGCKNRIHVAGLHQINGLEIGHSIHGFVLKRKVVALCYQPDVVVFLLRGTNYWPEKSNFLNVPRQKLHQSQDNQRFSCFCLCCGNVQIF